MREMKDSGIEWLGNIPELWCIKKLKYACEIYTGDSIKDDEKDLYTETLNAIPYISTKDIDANTNRIDYKNGLYIPVTNKKFKLAPKYSFLLCVEGGSAGKKIAYTAQDVNFVNKLCCFKSRKGTNSKFMYFYCQSDAFLTDFYLNMTGLIGGVSQSTLKNIRIATPHITQQQKIADYLDGECARIDGIVEKQRQIIEKLKEYKKSVITEAVTRGLNPDVPMKDSGIEWVGKIPEHWKVCRLKNYATICNGADYKEHLSEEGQYPIMGSGGAFAKSDAFMYDKDSVLLGRKGTVDKPIFIQEPFWTIDTMYYTQIKKTCIAKFFFYLCTTINFGFYQYGTALPSMTQRDLNSVLFTCPPLSEQQAIADYLDRKCSEIDSIIEKRERMIELMTEYKKSLIYECVTGKKEIVDVVE